MKKVVNTLDIFGVPVGVNYQGEGRYKTKFGALISLLTICFVLAFTGVRAMLLFTRGNTKITQTTSNLDLLGGNIVMKFDMEIVVAF